MIVGGYTLDLYCDCRRENRCKDGSFYGRDRAEAQRIAKREGWRFFFKRLPQEVYCPECAKKTKEQK